MKFAQKLNELMSEKQVSKKSLSEKTGLTLATVGNYLLGKSKPTAANLGKIAMALDCDYDELYKITFE